MNQIVDFTGLRLGKVEVVGYCGQFDQQSFWECKCVLCGSTCFLTTSLLKDGSPISPQCAKKHRGSDYPSERNIRAIKLLISGKSAAQTAREVQLTRERVSQIWEKYVPGVLYKRKIDFQEVAATKPCTQCGKILRRKIKRGKYLVTFLTGICAKCRAKMNSRTIICIICGNARTIPPSQVGRQAGKFCSRQCQGKFIGKNYGFLAHPENCGKGKSICKRGHPLIPENMRIYYYGTRQYRVCRLCSRIRSSIYYQKRKNKRSFELTHA